MLQQLLSAYPLPTDFMALASQIPISKKPIILSTDVFMGEDALMAFNRPICAYFDSDGQNSLNFLW